MTNDIQVPEISFLSFYLHEWWFYTRAITPVRSQHVLQQMQVSCVRQWINTYDPVALTPGIPPDMQPLPDTRCKSGMRRAPSGILPTRFFILDDEVGCANQ